MPGDSLQRSSRKGATKRENRDLHPLTGEDTRMIYVKNRKKKEVVQDI